MYSFQSLYFCHTPYLRNMVGVMLIMRDLGSKYIEQADSVDGYGSLSVQANLCNEMKGCDNE